MNPVIEPLIQHLTDRQIDVHVHSSNLRKDIEIISQATVLIASVGTFVPGVLCMSQNIRKVYYFNNSSDFFGNTTYECSLVKDKGDYAARVMSNKWANTAEQQRLMLEYPGDKLAG